jgi:hypothetical protein
MTDAPEHAALRDQCTVFLTGHGPVRVELYVGDATRAVPPGQVRDIVLALTAC